MTSRGQRLPEQPASRPDKRLPGEIFLVPWLFADEHDRRRLGAGAEDGLRRVPP